MRKRHAAEAARAEAARAAAARAAAAREEEARAEAARAEATRVEAARARRRRAIGWGIAAAAVLVVVVVVAAIALGGGGGDDDPGVEVEVPGAVRWTDTGVDVEVGDSVVLDATGTIRHNKDDPSTAVGPDGASDDDVAYDSALNEVGQGVYVNPPGHGGLVAKIGQDSEDVIGVGTHLEIDSSPTAGRLYLGINDYAGGDVDAALDNNDGSYQVTITGNDGDGS